MKNYIISSFSFLLIFNSCTNTESEKSILYQAPIQELTDEKYPDNFQIDSRTELWNKYDHSLFQVERIDANDFTIKIIPENSNSDTIIMEHVNLLAWIPTIPNHIVKDHYLKDIGIINAEWNRHQVRFNKGEFRISGNNKEDQKTFKVDLARNCLNSYAWEIITFTKEDGVIKPMYHGWFDFPKEFYRQLFNEVNEHKLTFEEYVDHLENYTNPENKVINFNVLREVIEVLCRS